MTSILGTLTAWALNRLGAVINFIRRLLAADHRPILADRNRPDMHYYAFMLFVAAAPSRSPKPLPPTEFIGQACHLVSEAFPNVFERPDYASPELVRYVKDKTANATHCVEVRPNGLISAQWALAVPPENLTLPLDEIVRIIKQVHVATLGSTHRSLFRSRWGKSRRRLDWRIGVNGWAVSQNGGNSMHWSAVTAPGRVPTKRAASPRPYCPLVGFAASHLRSVPLRRAVDKLLTPVLEELLSYGGYIDGQEIKDCVADALTGAVNES